MCIKDKEAVRYSGSSVDEVCLLDQMRKARFMGYFIHRTQESITLHFDEPASLTNDKSQVSVSGVNFAPTEVEFEVVKVFEFTPERKAMSVVVKSNDGKQYAYVKGADSSLLKMSRTPCPALEAQVEALAAKGLRTLVFGYKELKSTAADLTVEDVESDLTLLGVTGVEDMLQEDVKKCIEDFRDAGMRVWMLTGDKGATAREIAINCGLLDQKES